MLPSVTRGSTKSKTNSGGCGGSEPEKNSERSDESGTADADAVGEFGMMMTTTVEAKSGSETVCYQRASEKSAAVASGEDSA